MKNKTAKKYFIPAALLAVLAIVGLFGCLLIYSTCAMARDPLYYPMRQLIWLILGCFCFSLCAVQPFERFRKGAKYFFILFQILLFLVLIAGKKVNGMSGWFVLTDSIQFQPSEFTKPFFILYLSVLSGKIEMETEWKRLFKMLSATGCTVLFILLEPDTGSAGIFLASGLVLLWLSGFRKRILAGISVIGTAGVCLLIKPYVWQRIFYWLSPDSPSWHLRQFRYTLASGGTAGSETGTAVWSNAYLPLSHSDSIFASIVEMSGLTGGLIVLICYYAAAGTILYLTFSRKRASDARLTMAGITFLYLIQSVVHMGVNVLLLPPTGLTLPLLSYGGSSLCSTMLALGILYSAGREPCPVKQSAFSAA